MSKNPSDTQIMTTQGWKIKVPQFLKNKQYLITRVFTLTSVINFINSQYMFSVNKQVDLGTVCDVTKKNIFPTNTKHWSTYFTFCDTKRELMNNTKKKQSYLELTFDHALRD